MDDTREKVTAASELLEAVADVDEKIEILWGLFNYPADAAESIFTTAQLLNVLSAMRETLDMADKMVLKWRSP